MARAINSGEPDTGETESGIREISTEQVWGWLSAGWRDMLHMPGLSLFYGASLALLSALVTLLVVGSGAYHFLPLLLAGFMLVAPILGLGPFSAARRLEAEQRPRLYDALLAFRGNGAHIIGMGVILMLCFLCWMLAANLIVVFFHQGITPSDWRGLILMLLGSWEGAQLLAAGTYVGAMIALLVFAISAVSVPMLVDQPVNVWRAVSTSLTAVRRNILPMLLWAAILVSVVVFGFLTLFLGLVVGYPLVALASWHAYRDLVRC